MKLTVYLKAIFEMCETEAIQRVRRDQILYILDKEPLVILEGEVCISEKELEDLAAHSLQRYYEKIRSAYVKRFGEGEHISLEEFQVREEIRLGSPKKHTQASNVTSVEEDDVEEWSFSDNVEDFEEGDSGEIGSEGNDNDDDKEPEDQGN